MIAEPLQLRPTTQKPGSILTTLHVWKVYGRSADKAVYVLADTAGEAIAMASHLGRDLIARYMLSRSGSHVVPGFTERPS